jgi:hypothetical protein
VPQPSPTFTVEEFEYVEAGPGLALLRLAGVWRAGAPLVEVALVAVSGDEFMTLPPLPAPPAGEGMWRAAYSADPQLLSDPATTFELDPPAGRPIPLPRPLAHGSRATGAAGPAPVAPSPVAVDESPVSRLFGRRRQPPAEPESHASLSAALAAERQARHEAERAAAEERARAQRAEAVLAEELRSTVGKTEELIERIDGYEHSRVSFEDELDAVRGTHADLLAETEDEHRKELRAVREQLREAQRELALAQEELDAANHHVDTLHEAHSLELTAARSQRDDAEERQATLERQLAQARQSAEEVRGRLEDREDLIERARAEAAQANTESAELQAAVAHLRDAVAARAREAATARRRFVRDPEGLDRSREELRRDAERIAALERQAEALRDAIHSQLPYSLHASPLQEVLPVSEPDETQVDA